ncbi:MAG: MBL fold metallo-hydrolase [Trueperaceae bacterium]
MIEHLDVVERENIGWDKRIRSFTASDLVDVFVIITERYLVVFDTGNAPQQMQIIMNAVKGDLQGRQLLVINSHQHYDHTWGNALFVNGYPAPIIGHERSAIMLKEKYDEALSFLREQQKGRPFLGNVQIVAPTLTFSKNFTIHGGDLTLELFPTPGHSVDHISLWIPEIKTVLAADTAEHPIPYAEADSSVRQLEQDLELLQSFNPDIVLPCHGGTVEVSLFDRNLRYFATLREKVKGAKVDAGLEPNTLPDAISWTFEMVMQDLGLTEEFSEFYRGLHVQNIQSILKEIA